MVGSLALVGSGEYLPEMLELEKLLFDDGVQRGKQPRFIQIPTAAGLESKERLRFWEDLGKRQADRLGAESVFLPVFNRHDAEDSFFAEQLDDAALIYLSGGNPSHLAFSLRGTPLGRTLFEAWQSGSSVAGCSAGAMALCSKVVGLRLMNEGTEGLGFVPHMQVLPHFDRYFRWVPERAITKLVKDTEDATLVGIDELTALVSRGDGLWQVHGRACVHILNTHHKRQHSHDEYVTFEH